MFRILRILSKLPKQPYDPLKIRILDFYLLFPGHLREVSFPSSARRLAKEFRRLKINKYETLKDSNRIFIKLEPYQNAALRTLTSYELIDKQAYAGNHILRSDVALPVDIENMMSSSNERAAMIMNTLTDVLAETSLHGESGLKSRTGLFEYRYDPT